MRKLASNKHSGATGLEENAIKEERDSSQSHSISKSKIQSHRKKDVKLDWSQQLWKMKEDLHLQNCHLSPERMYEKEIEFLR